MYSNGTSKSELFFTPFGSMRFIPFLPMPLMLARADRVEGPPESSWAQVGDVVLTVGPTISRSAVQSRRIASSFFAAVGRATEC